MAGIQSLDWELPYTTGAAKKGEKKKKTTTTTMAKDKQNKSPKARRVVWDSLVSGLASMVKKCGFDSESNESPHRLLSSQIQ